MQLSYWVLTLTPLLALLSYAILVFVVLRRAVGSRLQRSFAFYLLVMAAWSLGSAMMRLDPDRIRFWNQVTTGSVIVMPLAFFAFVQVFLNETRNRWMLAGIVAVVGLQVANGLGLLVTDVSLLEGGLIRFGLAPLGYLMSIFGAFFLGFSIYCLALAHHRTSNPVLKNRIRYPLMGGTIVLLGGLSNLIDVLGYYPVDHAANLINAFLLTYVILRHQLVDISLVVRRGLFYSIPTAIIGIVYFLSISFAAVLFNVVAGVQLLLVSLLVAAIAAVVAQPLRDRAQLWIDRLFFREKYDASLMLQRLSHTAASVLDLDHLTSMILDGVTETMHIERAVFFLKQEESGEFRTIAHRGLDADTDIRLRSDHPIVDWLSRHEQALSRHEMDLNPQFKALWGHELGNLQKLGAELYIPLRASDDLIGILSVSPKLSEEAYSQDDQLTLTTLANQTATALENARLHEETRRRYRELALLNRVIAASATSLQIESFLTVVCQQLTSAFGELEAAAVLPNEEGTGAIVMTEDGLVVPQPGDRLPGLAVLLVGEGRVSWDPTIPLEGHQVLQLLLDYRSPLIMDDAWTDPHLVPILDSVRRCGISSLLSLPLLVEGQVGGLVCLAASNLHPFTADEIDLAQRVAEQVSGALARAHLAGTQRRLSTAVEQAAEAVMITDIDGTILYVNPAFEQTSGYKRAEAIGQNPRILKSGRHRDAFYKDLWQTITGGQAWQGRIVNRKNDGTLYTGETTITPMRDASGHIINYVATIRDVTREEQLEQQFYESQKMEALGRLAGGIAHDFNNLLTVISLSTQFLKRTMRTHDPLWDHVQRIGETGDRAAQLTRQLLSFSRREVVKLQVLSLSQVVIDLTRMLQRIIGEDIKLVVNAAEDLWLVEADPSQLEQVIINLAVNSRDAMPQGGTLTIETANAVLDQAYAAHHLDAPPGAYVKLTVSDTGIGMDNEVKAHLFEPFFTTKERGRGTGLGLATVFGIVKQGEGHIQVQSQVGGGTTFEIYLPRTHKTRLEIADQAPAPTKVRGTETILVVEDELSVREMTVQTLESHGYQVLAAGNGLEAIQVAAEHSGPIDLLLTDVVMPHLDGQKLVEQLQPERPAMHVVYMSGYVERPFIGQLASDPDVSFLSKPFTAEILTQKIRSVLDRNA